MDRPLQMCDQALQLCWKTKYNVNASSKGAPNPASKTNNKPEKIGLPESFNAIINARKDKADAISNSLL